MLEIGDGHFDPIYCCSNLLGGNREVFEHPILPDEVPGPGKLPFLFLTWVLILDGRQSGLLPQRFLKVDRIDPTKETRIDQCSK